MAAPFKANSGGLQSIVLEQQFPEPTLASANIQGLNTAQWQPLSTLKVSSVASSPLQCSHWPPVRYSAPAHGKLA